MMADFQFNDNNTCVVCFKNVLYYSIGECDHPVCYECSTRMRVLCLQNECPICRQDLARVVFTDSILPYKELRNTVFTDKLFERQYKIGFCTDVIKLAYEKLLENRCKLCENLPPFRSFSNLSDHMRKVHEKFYCELCVKHIKIFTSERRCYTRPELGHHRRKGDTDDTSHKGHPLCEFCEERFMDADELYRHLRKEHLYCHLCDADGRNQYYASHQALAQHFRTEHFLCEEGECAGQHLTAVFRSEIDLKAHKASVHGRGLARAAARQARTLELQFNITPHPVAQRMPRNGENAASVPETETAPTVTSIRPPFARIDTASVEQFPRLSAAAPAPVLINAHTRSYKGGDGLTRNDRNFPALDGGNGVRSTAPPPARPANGAPVAAAIVRNSKPSVSIQLHSQPTSASNFRLTQATGNRISIPPQQQKKNHLSDDDFPSLGGMPRDDHPSIGAGTVQQAKIKLISSQEMQSLKGNQTNNHYKKPQLSAEAFPALSSTAPPTAPPQWITVSKPKDKNKGKHQETIKPKEPSFHPVADFPTLPISTAKPKAKKQPQAQPPPSQNDYKLISKKEKKKQNTKENKKENANDYDHDNGYDTELYNHDYMLNNNSISNESKVKSVTTAVTLNSDKPKKSNNFAMKQSDYPPLSLNASTAPPSSPMVNGTTPAFASVMRPSPAPSCDVMTFTNSSGETFPAPVHEYIRPPNFENRNRALVDKFSIAFGSKEAMDDFKVASREFRDSVITGDEFYRHCESSLGDFMETLFPELVALLPDIAKQQELIRGKPARALVEVCSACGQLLTPSDTIAHDRAHWPALAP